MDRSAIMDKILFPENSEDLVVIPSNKEGTGFLNHCYSKEYLKNFLHEEEFNKIVLAASKIAANAYSKKRILDKQGIPKKVKVQMYLASLLAILSMGFVGLSALNKGLFAMVLAQICLAPAMVIVMLISIKNW